ncbi:MAG: glycosyl hydrolase, partial [Flammeovirgaceae bacterium]|nr:glycosyl hydrolase [Flammeovirgaceae bacterium]
RTLEEEKKREENLDIPFPGWRALELENRAQVPQVILTVRDEDGIIINTLPAKNKKGVNRVTWDLTYASKSPIKLNAPPSKTNGYTSGFMVIPATYNVTLSKVIKGVVTDLSAPVNFEVVPLISPALKGVPFEAIDEFRSDYESFVADLTKQDLILEKSLKIVGALRNAMKRVDKRDASLVKNLFEVHQSLLDISLQMNGETVKSEVGEKSNPTPKDGLMIGYMALSTTYGPTQNHIDALSRAHKQLNGLANALTPISKQTLPDLIEQFKKLGGPWVEGLSDIE